MQTDREIYEHLPLGLALEELLKSENSHGPSISEITGAVREKGFGLVLMVLSLPSALPVPAPGYSTPFGIVIGLIALQMILGRQTLWIPKRLQSVRIRPAFAKRMLGTSAKFLKKIERFVRPRQRWIRSRGGQAGLAVVILTMACLMMLPIPLTNTFPAMVVFLIGIGLSEEDGLLAISAFGVGLLAIFLYACIIYIFATQGPEAVDGIKNWI
ncbi:MAG TPA: exopolysaccharide biosynthesis protein, partial [Opitutales bacterium]|nr:exopolysaccharide biosynthesis protein [Opitutales bacterium]